MFPPNHNVIFYYSLHWLPKIVHLLMHCLVTLPFSTNGRSFIGYMVDQAPNECWAVLKNWVKTTFIFKLVFILNLVSYIFSDTKVEF
jgi:hypothetical protein